jgi:dihydrofolate reductase
LRLRPPHHTTGADDAKIDRRNEDFARRKIREYWTSIRNEPEKPVLPSGGRTIASLIDAGLVDELRLLVYPLIAGAGKPLFAAAERRHALGCEAPGRFPTAA